MVQHEISACDGRSLEFENILARFELEIVANTHRGDHNSHVLSKLLANGLDTIQQISFGAALHNGDEPITHLKLQGVHCCGGLHRPFLRLQSTGGGEIFAFLVVLFPSFDEVSASGGRCREDKEGEESSLEHCTHHEKRARENIKHALIEKQLPTELLTHALAR